MWSVTHGCTCCDLGKKHGANLWDKKEMRVFTTGDILGYGFAKFVIFQNRFVIHRHGHDQYVQEPDKCSAILSDKAWINPKIRT